MLNVIFTRMEIQAMEVDVPKYESENVELCEVDETVHSDDSVNQDTDESIIYDIVNDICDSAIQSIDQGIKTKELAQDIIRSMSQVSNSLLSNF